MSTLWETGSRIVTFNGEDALAVDRGVGDMTIADARRLVELLNKLGLRPIDDLETPGPNGDYT